METLKSFCKKSKGYCLLVNERPVGQGKPLPDFVRWPIRCRWSESLCAMINNTTFKVYNKTIGAVQLTATLGNLWSCNGKCGWPYCDVRQSGEHCWLGAIRFRKQQYFISPFLPHQILQVHTIHIHLLRQHFGLSEVLSLVGWLLHDIKSVTQKVFCFEMWCYACWICFCTFCLCELLSTGWRRFLLSIAWWCCWWYITCSRAVLVLSSHSDMGPQAWTSWMWLKYLEH